MKLPFGKYAGYELSQVPDEYLNWLSKSNRDTLEAVEAEIYRRSMSMEASLSWAERIILAGYRELCKRHHPDHGGSTRDMQDINAAMETLRQGTRIAKEVLERNGK